MAVTLENVGGWPAILGKILSGQDLTTDEASAALDDVLEGTGDPGPDRGFRGRASRPKVSRSRR